MVEAAASCLRLSGSVAADADHPPVGDRLEDNVRGQKQPAPNAPYVPEQKKGKCFSFISIDLNRVNKQTGNLTEDSGGNIPIPQCTAQDSTGSNKTPRYFMVG